MPAWRTHQADILDIAGRILQGESIRQIICPITPGGGKSLIPVILAAKLIPAFADRLCWVTPRKALQAQGALSFSVPWVRAELNHAHRAMVSANHENPSRGESAYITTYQALGADKKQVHLSEFKRRRYILVLDEPHHIEDGSPWHEAVGQLVDRAVLTIYMSGTFERGDGSPIAFVPYRISASGIAIDLSPSPDTAIVPYTLHDAWRDKAIIPITVNYVDCQATWEDRRGNLRSVERLATAGQYARPALYTALHTQAAYELLEKGCADWTAFRQANPRSKLLIVAPNIAQARQYADWLKKRRYPSLIATSEDTNLALKHIQQFRASRHRRHSILVTVAMAYEGLDVPAITHVICLTHIRSKPWIEQLIHRATRVDHHAGPYESQRAVIYAPDDHLFRQCVSKILAAQQASLLSFGKELFNGGKTWERQEPETEEGIKPIASATTGERQCALWDASVQANDGNGRAEAIPPEEPLPHETIRKLRLTIEKYGRRYERLHSLPHGTINRAIIRCFQKSRQHMTIDELRKVLEWTKDMFPMTRAS